ncbi:MAG: hypothetical protein KME26_06380 [Oscillatoria princeps RMCB-10]|nr:hypothetical protein [Oscillatoria princeps RMCB-10]
MILLTQAVGCVPLRNAPEALSKVPVICSSRVGSPRKRTLSAAKGAGDLVGFHRHTTNPISHRLSHL